MLLGGYPKEDTYERWQQILKQTNMKNIYLFGQAAPIINSSLQSGLVCGSFATVKQALSCLYQFAAEGEVVLFSPGCSSYDEFDNFEHRGLMFKQWVKELWRCYET